MELRHLRGGAGSIGGWRDAAGQEQRSAGQRDAAAAVPAARSVAGRPSELAYVEIADACETLAHVGASPYWCWGHELGLNERGVAIGNEALFTRDLARNQERARAGRPPEPGILGMEFVRLGLERGRTASEAMEVMTGCSSVTGSGARACRGSRARRRLRQLLPDRGRREAWVLETSGRRWIAARVRGPLVVGLNQATIRTGWDRASEDVVAHAVEAGWWPARTPAPARLRGGVHGPAGAAPGVAHPAPALTPAAWRGGCAAGERTWPRQHSVLRDHYVGTFLEGPYFNAGRDPTS